jgi:AraC-like DNA-binding protein
MPVTPQICPVVLRNAATELTEALGESNSLFRGLGLSPDTIHTAPNFLVSYRQASAVLRRALQLSAASDLALRVGRRRSAVTSGIAGLGFLASCNLREACDLVARHAWAYGCPLHVTTRAGHDGSLLVEVTPMFTDTALEAFWVEEFFCSMTMLARNLLGPAFRAARMEFQSTVPPHELGLKHFVGCHIAHDQSSNRMVVDALTADAISPSADSVVRRSVVEMLDQLKEHPRRSDTCETVEQQLREHLHAPPTLAQLAATLNISERTLRRRLVVEGTSYHQLLDDVRKERALDLLRDHTSAISEVTAALGFTDIRNFRRAVKRWTGQAPSSLRKAP